MKNPDIASIKERLDFLLSPLLEEVWDALSLKIDVISKLLPLMGDKIKFRVLDGNNDLLEVIIKRKREQKIRGSEDQVGGEDNEQD